MHADFCVEALSEALKRYGAPEIMNTDQGSQFTGAAWIMTLTEAGVQISMDGRGVQRAFAAPLGPRSRFTMDNIFIERLWRSLKQEAVYLTEITDGFHGRRVIRAWVNFYNAERPHTALGRRTPDEACGDREMGKLAA